MTRRVDVAVLGAGIVGVSAALQLLARGRSVALVDRLGSAGRATSYGNAGLIERSSIMPYFMPRDWRELLRHAFNQKAETHYHLSALPRLAPFLIGYYTASRPDRMAASAAAVLPLIERSLSEHAALVAAAGADHLVRPSGWIKAFRTARSRDAAFAEAGELTAHGLVVDRLDAAALAAREPHLAEGVMAGAIHMRDPAAVSDPGALSLAYAALFRRQGGAYVQGDATTLAEAAPGWRLDTQEGPLLAREAVVALGPWSADLVARFGYRLPFGIKRGYHRHYRPRGNAGLIHPVLDADGGYLLAPMAQGLRLTTGAEFALRDAPKTPVQLARVEPLARRTFPIGEPVEAEPWMGARPCLPDMLPVIGPAPRHAGLWFDFGHQHHGLTLGPASGRLLAELMTGAAPCADPAPFRIDRF